MQMQIGY